MSVSLWDFPNSSIEIDDDFYIFQVVVHKPSRRRIFLTINRTQCINNSVEVQFGNTNILIRPSEFVIFDGKEGKGSEGYICDRYEFAFENSKVIISRLDNSSNKISFKNITYPINLCLKGKETVMRAIRIQ